ncbi:hypothetical protein [Kiloniella sp.]|uniref:hypothetical protein n=1 Tax=Kiloniella sp. TaxID=1938587 RepID=UPI003B02132F
MMAPEAQYVLIAHTGYGDEGCPLVEFSPEYPDITKAAREASGRDVYRNQLTDDLQNATFVFDCQTSPSSIYHFKDFWLIKETNKQILAQAFPDQFDFAQAIIELRLKTAGKRDYYSHYWKEADYPGPFWIAKLRTQIDCIAEESTGFKWRREQLEETSLSENAYEVELPPDADVGIRNTNSGNYRGYPDLKYATQIVFRPGIIPDGSKIFGLTYCPDCIFIQRDLSEKLKSDGYNLITLGCGSPGQELDRYYYQMR